MLMEGVSRAQQDLSIKSKLREVPQSYHASTHLPVTGSQRQSWSSSLSACHSFPWHQQMWAACIFPRPGRQGRRCRGKAGNASKAVTSGDSGSELLCEQASWAGGWYEGDFQNNQLHGQGCTSRLAVANWFVFCLQGSMGWQNGKVYTGTWASLSASRVRALEVLKIPASVREVQDRMDGQGQETWPDGRCYQGSYVKAQLGCSIVHAVA